MSSDPLDVPILGHVEPLAAHGNVVAALALLPPSCARFVSDHEDAFLNAPGSGSNHQFWVGGYADHLDEIFAIAATTYRALAALRPLPFSLESALLVLFLHDVEKCFKRLPVGVPRDAAYEQLAFDQRELQRRVMSDYGIVLDAEEENALRYIHGELDDYRKDERVMGRLAVFVHSCDYFSARGWFDQPRESGRLPDVVSG